MIVFAVVTCIPEDGASSPLRPALFASKQGAEDYFSAQVVFDIGPEQLPSYGVAVEGQDFPVVIDYDRAVELHDAFAEDHPDWGRYEIFELEVLP